MRARTLALIVVLAGSTSWAQPCGGIYAAGNDLGTLSSSSFGLPTGGIHSTAYFDDGSGNGQVLYAAGSGFRAGGIYTYLAKFVNGHWSPVAGFDAEVDRITVFDAGGGPRLYAVGAFRAAPGGVSCGRIAVFDGAVWTAMGSLPDTGRCFLGVRTEQGAEVYVGTGTQSAATFKWNGTQWTRLGPAFTDIGSFPGGIRDLAYFDDGAGAKLYALASVNWDAAHFGAAHWSPDAGAWIGTTGLSNLSTVGEMSQFVIQNDSDGPHLYAAGRLLAGNTPCSVAKLNAGVWTALPSARGPSDISEGCSSLLTVSDPGGAYLVGAIGSDAHRGVRVRAFRDGQWVTWGPDFTNASGGFVCLRGLIQRPDDGLVSVFNNFTSVGPVQTPAAAGWNGRAWGPFETVGRGRPASSRITRDPDIDDQWVYDATRRLTPTSELPYDVPVSVVDFVRLHTPVPARAIIGGGRVYQDSGSGWVALPAVSATRLWVSGDLGFDTLVATGSGSAFRFMNGTWAQVGQTVPNTYGFTALETFDDGSGGRLYAGNVGQSITSPHLLVLESGVWQTIPFASPVRSLKVYSVGSRPELIIGADDGAYAYSGGSARRLSSGLSSNGGVYTLQVMDAGDGPHLWCTQNAPYEWDAGAWRTNALWATNGVIASIVDLQRTDGGRSFFMGGDFQAAGGVPSYFLAELRFCPQPCTADFNHDGDTGTDRDIEAFFACLAGNCCPTCSTADFNNDGDVGTDGDIESFFRVLAGGAC